MNKNDYENIYFERYEDGFAAGHAEGEVKGREEGREEGSQQARIEFARKLLVKGLSINEISELTGLSEEECLAHCQTVQ